MSKQAETLPTSPEELLRYCEGELLRLRSRRASARQHRGVILAVSLLMLGLGAMAAFMFLFTRLQEMPHSGHDAPAGISSAGLR